MLFQSVLAHLLAQDGPDDGREPVIAPTGAGLARIRMHFTVPPVVDETTELAPGTAFLFVNVDDVALARPRVFTQPIKSDSGAMPPVSAENRRNTDLIAAIQAKPDVAA